MNPAFIVEGRAEQKIVQRLCPGKKVMILECNGDSVAFSAIAKKIASLIRICGNRNYPIIIQLDREKRLETGAEVARQIANLLVEMGHPLDQFRIGISDRELESWILYGVSEQGDFDSLCGASLEGEFEGTSGEWMLRQRLSSAGQPYHKTTIGVELFISLSAKALASRSPSFAAFANSLGLDCAWLAT